MKALKTILLLFIAYTFSGCCSVSTRFIAKHPECFTADTVVTYDTIIEEEVRHDTTLLPVGEVDTFYIEKENVRTRIIRVRDTLRVTSTIEADAVVVPRYIIKKIPKPIIKKEVPKWYWYVMCMLIGIIITLWILYKTSRK